MKLSLNRIFFFFFLFFGGVVFLIFYMQYSYSKDILIQNFINKHYVESLKIKDKFKNLLDEIQYKFKIHQDEDLKKLDTLYLLYSKKFNVSEVAKILNKDVKFGHYEVFLIDKNYIVTKASYKPDIGFDLGKFKVYKKILQDVFDGKRKIDISPLHLDISSLNLKKYYLILSPDKKYLLQIAYVVDVFQEAKKLYESIQAKDLSSLEIFYVEKYLIYKIDFSKRFNQKIPLDVIRKNSKNIVKSIAKELGVDSECLNNLPLTLKNIFKKRHLFLDLEHHKLIVYTLIEGIFNKENSLVVVKSIYKTDELEKNLLALKKRFLLLFVALFVVVILGYYFIISKISNEIKNMANSMMQNRDIENEKSLIKEFEILKKEYNRFRKLLNLEVEKNIKLLENNKRFILDTIHQIKTPLSVMTLNIDFVKSQVKNEEVKEILEEIEAAVTMLNNSYEDLSYLAGNGVLKYEAKEEINVSEVLKERIRFFEAVAKANNKKIVANIEDDFMFKINKVELDRIIDNNLSNAIKYSSAQEIIVELKDGVLRFLSGGERIKGKMKVFDKNYREHSHKRGLGIGLNIVKEICEKYRVEYNVSYEDGKNVFEYNFGKISKKG